MALSNGKPAVPEGSPASDEFSSN